MRQASEVLIGEQYDQPWSRKMRSANKPSPQFEGFEVTTNERVFAEKSF